MSTGQISYLSLLKYAREMELGPDQTEMLWDVVKKLDAIYLKMVAPKKPPPSSRK